MSPARAPSERPAGLSYQPDLLSGREEAELIAWLEALDYATVEMRGQVARRTVRHFGFSYDYESFGIVPSDPLPDELLGVRERCAELGGVEPERLAQALVNRYPPGAPIGWHRDAPAFGSPVVGVSLASACRMRFQRGTGDERRVHEIELEPRSGYALAGAARWQWQHSIPPVRQLRYSVTFRTLRER